MSIIKTAKVWIGGAAGVTAPIHLSQYDTAWRFQFSVYNGGTVYSGSEDTEVYMEGRKADGTVFAVPGTFSNGVANVECSATITSAVGTIACELRISEDEETVGTANFDMIVEAAPLRGHIASGDDFSAMQQVLDGANEAASDALSSKNAAAESAAAAALSAATAQVSVSNPYVIAATAAAMTDHTKAYVYTGSETGYVTGGWYYWNGTAWTLGGQATDPTLSVAGAPADAASCGDLKSALTDITGNQAYQVTESGYIKTNGTTVDINDVISSSNYVHAVYPCAAGDVVFIKDATGGASPRVCCFIDSTGNVLYVTPESPGHKVNLMLTAPQNTSKVIFNCGVSEAIEIYSGKLLVNQVSDLESGLNETSQNLSETNQYAAANKANIDNYNDGLLGFRNSINSAETMIVFVGDSWTAGQGATETGGAEVSGMTTPGRSDGFHTPDASSGKFVDEIARTICSYYPLSMASGYVRCDNQTTRTYTGSWTYDNSPSIPEEEAGARAFAQSSTVGDKAIVRSAYNYLKIHILKGSFGGKASIKARVWDNTGDIITSAGLDSMWKPLSQIPGVKRNDNYTDIDYIDTYQRTTDYTQFLEIIMPYGKSWEFEFTIVTKTYGSSLGNFCLGSNRYYNNFYNAGRGNHTTADFLGISVSEGAGKPGDAPYGDNTDHVAEVLNLNPTLIIFEPMIINDWFHGLNLQHSRDCVEDIIKRFKDANCDIVALMPGPVVTTDDPWDYTGEPAPLTTNLHGLGTYKQYYVQTMFILGKHQIRTVNTYEFFKKEYESADHQNWTTGNSAGRIHVNQHGHDIITEAFFEKSKLAGDVYNL